MVLTTRFQNCHKLYDNILAKIITLFTDEIIDRIHESGFRIAAQKETNLTRELAEEFYAEHKGKEYYDELVEHMTRLVCYQVKTTCLYFFSYCNTWYKHVIFIHI